VKPRVVTGTPRLKTGDGVFCVNFRADRMRQLVRALALEGFDAFDVTDRPRVSLVTMTQYDETFPFPVAFGPMVLAKIVAEVLADRGKTMFRTAETEKYAHVTYFFNGGLETPYKGEGRVLATADKAGATLLITADHGNCELMIDPMTGGPHTAHTTNPVPLVLVGGDDARGPLRDGGSLRDVGPTILNLLGVEIPREMTG